MKPKTVMPPRKISFVSTRHTLLERMSGELSRENETAWLQFFELYQPVMLKYAELFCDRSQSDDIVQKVLVKLVSALRAGRYVRRPGAKFRSYLMTLIRNEFIDWRRHESSRKCCCGGLDCAAQAVTNVTPADFIDAEWRLARRSAAIEHVLSQTAMPDLMRRAYRMHVVEGRPAKEVAAALGVRQNYVVLAKSRISRRIASAEAIYGD